MQIPVTTVSTTKAIGSRARRKADRPGEILDAAFEEFVQSGYVATRVEDIAARVGVTKGTIYFYFETKEKLFEEMIRHVSVPFSDVKTYLQALQGPYEQRLKDFIRIVYQRIAADRNSRELLRFMIAEGSRFPGIVDHHYDEFILPLMGALRELFEAGVAAGEFRSSPLTKIPEIALSPGLLMSFWIMLFSDRKVFDLDAFVDAHIEVLLNGLLSKAPL